MTRGVATPQSSRGRPLRSFRSGITADCGKTIAQRHAPATKPCAPLDIWQGLLEALEQIPRPQPKRAKMRCLKTFGERIMSRGPYRQTAEIHISIALMYRFNALGTAENIHVARLERGEEKSRLRPELRNNAGPHGLLHTADETIIRMTETTPRICNDDGQDMRPMEKYFISEPYYTMRPATRHPKSTYGASSTTPASSNCSRSGRSRRLSNPNATRNCSVVTKV